MQIRLKGNSKPLDPCPHWIHMRVVLTAEILALLSRGQGNNVCSQIFVAHARWLLFLKEKTDFSCTALMCMCSLIPGASQSAMWILSSNAMNCREWVGAHKKSREKVFAYLFPFHCNGKKCRCTSSYRHAGDGLPEHNVGTSIQGYSKCESSASDMP